MRIKVQIWKDEAFPVYGVGNTGPEVEIDKRTLHRWARVERMYMAAQHEMATKYNEAERSEA